MAFFKSTRNFIRSFAVLVMAAWLSACATVGKDFSETKINQLVINSTSQQEVKALFGSPWRVGSESGQTTWTYGLYKYSAFNPSATKDLVIRFNKDGSVASYTFNTTEHNE
ncbi:outer membrane protein assembly factor BamE [Litoribrevibacter euphylliae]|uniref:Outer membrane protein assembly factor BamE n=1 Tax=Litoribrevibacter euphylliae TaxID=1834034 RepID=A0ABV7HIN0_9GAMM